MKKAICILLISMMVGSTVMGCSGSGGDTIKIGAVGPLTGDSSNGGTDELEGKEMEWKILMRLVVWMEKR